MGRATYSSRNAKSAVADPVGQALGGRSITVDNNSAISSWRVARFDPDAEEFFRDAEYEAPLNPDEVRQQSAALIAEEVQREVLSDSASDTSSDTTSDSGASESASASLSPLPVRPPGIDDVLHWQMQDLLVEGDAPRRPRIPAGEEALAAHAQVVQMAATLEIPPEPRPQQNSDNTRGRADLGHVLSATRSWYRPRSATAIPAMYVPVAATGPTIAAAAAGNVGDDEVPVPAAPRPAMASAAAVAHSPTRVTSGEASPLISPSPAGSVTPSQVYSWRPSPTPRTRPTNINRESPFTNSRARVSYARLVHVSPPVPVHRGAN